MNEREELVRAMAAAFNERAMDFGDSMSPDIADVCMYAALSALEAKGYALVKREATPR